MSLVPGSIFAHDFRVERPLDAGGMGSVYVVEQISTGSRRALKLMHPGLVTDPKMRERFLQEARVSAKIQSDHVVQVIAAGIEERGQVPWLAMELLAGEELDSRVKRDGAMARGEVKLVCEQLGHALRAAHAAQIVHRDLKPSNIYLCPSRIAGLPFSVKVLDFGIAKILAEAQTSSTQGMGTPLWMAPEQTESRGQVGAATDIWPFGLIVYFMLTGKMYWNSANNDSSGVHSVLRELLMEPIVAPSVRAREQGCPPPPPGFDAWFARCLERDFGRRPSNIGPLVDELGLILTPAQAGQVEPRHDGTAYAPPPPAHAMGTTPTGAPYPPIEPSHSGAYAPPNQFPQTPGSQFQQHPSGTQFAQTPPQFTQTPPQFTQLPGGPPGGVTPPPPRANPRRGVNPAVWALVGLLLVGGVGGAIYAVTGSDSRDRKSRSSDDDDDDEPRKKKKRSTTEDVDVGIEGDGDGPLFGTTSKADDCKALIDLMTNANKKFEALGESLENSGPEKLITTANEFDTVARDARALVLSDTKLVGFRDRYASMVSNMSKSLRGLKSAVDRNDQAGITQGQKDIADESKLEDPLVADVNSYCGF